MMDIKFATTLILALITCIPTTAQIVMNQFLKDTATGEPVEKGKYNSNNDVPVLGCWMGAIDKTPSKGAASPVAGQPLLWSGYGEKDLSIVLGSSFSAGIHGQRPLCYGFQRSISTGELYLSFITDIKEIKNRKYWTAVGFTSRVWGIDYWCCACFYPEGRDGTSYNVGIRLAGGLMVVDKIFQTGEKHLVVLKYDFDDTTLSVFIDPDLSKPEPRPDEKVKSSISDTNNSIIGLYFRDVSDNVGRIGSFRVARVWEDIR